MANEKRLTEKDKIAFSAISKFIKENGYSPTVRELCRITGKSSTSTIQQRLKSLESKGYIKTTSMGKRTIRITKGIEEQPTIDAVNREGCKWCNGEYHTTIMATAIRHHSNGNMDGYELKANYCPNCGEKMDGDGNV